MIINPADNIVNQIFMFFTCVDKKNVGFEGLIKCFSEKMSHSYIFML